MGKLFLFFICVYLFNSSVVASPRLNLIDSSKEDYKRFYSLESLGEISVGFLGGAALAHSDFDEKFQNYYQKNLRSKSTDELAKVSKLLGEKNLVIPLTLFAYNLPNFTDLDRDSRFSTWIDNSMRNYMLTMPLMLTMQKVTGGSRPNEKKHNSRWKPFQDKNGVSGHAAGGAIPFLSAAIMYEKGSWQRNSLVFASTLTALSRVNDNQHYLSQSFLGWYLSYKASETISENNQINKRKDNFEMSPLFLEDGLGLQIKVDF